MSIAELPPLVTTLSSLASAANAELAGIAANDEDSLARAIRCGESLLQAKELCAHGRWSAWLAENMSCRLQTAYKYMRIAKFKDDVAHCASIAQAHGWLVTRGMVRTDENGSSPDRSDFTAAQRQKVLQLRSQDVVFREIAEQLDISLSYAQYLARGDESRAYHREWRKSNAAKAKKNKELAEKVRFEKQMLSAKGPRKDFFLNLRRVSEAAEALQWDADGNVEARALADKLYSQAMEMEETFKAFNRLAG